MSQSISGQTNENISTQSSSGSQITTLQDAAADESNKTTDDSTTTSSSSLLEGEQTFEELIGDICSGIDLIFAVKRGIVVVTDYESIFAEAKYLRQKNNHVIQDEDIKMWQLEDDSYQLDVNQYGFYNVVKVYYNKGVITESYQDLVNIYGKMIIEYHEENLNKTSAQVKAKAYLAAHVRDFNMSIKANILWNGEIDIGDIVTIDNPLTLRDKNKIEVEKKDPEYYFVKGKSISWDGESPIIGTLELTYGPESPEAKEVPEVGTTYSKSNKATGLSVDIDTALDEVGRLASKKSYSNSCQSYSCMKNNNMGDCWGMSNFISCELKSRNIETRIMQYPTSSSSRHRSVQYKDKNGVWKNFPYREYNISQSFYDTSGIKHGKRVKGDCD